MRLDLYQAETERIATDQAAVLEEAAASWLRTAPSPRSKTMGSCTRSRS